MVGEKEFIHLYLAADIYRYEYNLSISSKSTYFTIQLVNKDKFTPYVGGSLTLDETKELIAFLQDTVKETECE